MSILVTGATGQLGKLVLNHLLNKVPASEVMVSVRNPEKADFLAKQGVTVRQGNFNDPSSLVQAFSGASKILIISTSEPDPLVRTRQHLNAIETAKQIGVKHIVYTGTAFPEKIIPTPLPLRAYGHLATEHTIRTLDIPYTFLRNGFYREGFVNSSLLSTAVEKGEFISATGNGPLNFAECSDYAKAAAVVLTEPGHENKAYELTSNKLWNYSDVADIVSEISGRDVSHRSVSATELKELYVKSGMPEFIAGNIAQIHKDIDSGIFGMASDDLSDLIGSSLTSLRESVTKILQT